MTKLKSIFIVFVICLIYVGCGLDNKPYSDVSSNVKEAAERKTLLEEYKVDSLRIFDPTKKFAIESVWLEKSWGTNYDSNGKEHSYINDKVSNVIFKISNNSFLKEGDFLKNWTIKNTNDDNVGLIGSSNQTKIFVTVSSNPKPNTKWVVYKLNEPNVVYKNTVKIAEFNLVKK